MNSKYFLKNLIHAQRTIKYCSYYARKNYPKSYERIRENLDEAQRLIQDAWLMADTENNGNITFGIGE